MSDLTCQEIELAVEALLKDVAYRCKYLGEVTLDGWDCDSWKFTIGKFDFDYYTGMGHRVLTAQAKLEVERKFPLPLHPSTQHYRNYKLALKAAETPGVPHVTGLLACLVSVEDYCTTSFEEWCNETGYSTDSRKALDRYLQSQRDFSKFKQALPAEIREKLKELLQDY